MLKVLLNAVNSRIRIRCCKFDCACGISSNLKFVGVDGSFLYMWKLVVSGFGRTVCGAPLVDCWHKINILILSCEFS